MLLGVCAHLTSEPSPARVCTVLTPSLMSRGSGISFVFETSLAYRMSSKTTQKNPVLKSPGKKTESNKDYDATLISTLHSGSSSHI